MSNETKTEFTDKQISDWRKFEAVRSSGSYNMHDPRARKATGLSSDEYQFAMNNCSSLKAAAAK